MRVHDVRGMILQVFKRLNGMGKVLMNDVWRSSGIDFGCASSRALWWFQIREEVCKSNLHPKADR